MTTEGHCPKCHAPRKNSERTDELCQHCIKIGYTLLCRDGFQRWLDREDAKLKSLHRTQLGYMRSPKRS